MHYYESTIRALVKTISWRISATLVTIIIVYVLTGKLEIAVIIGGVEVIAKMVLYFLHERTWNYIGIGKKEINPFVLWFTGLSGSGKSTLGNMVYEYLKKKDYKVERLDGDTVRSIFPNTGFSKEDRDGHVKRIGYLSSMLEKNGVMVISSFISPYRESRDFVRDQCNNFIEIYVNASVEECENRDVKGLYKKARTGEINNFTGVSDPYEEPRNPELIIDSDNEAIEESFNKIINYLRKYI